MSQLWVVVPAYCEEHGIAATLDALADQQDPDFTLVIVDNGSTDRTTDVVADFAAANPQLRLHLLHEPQKGTGSAADTGMRFAASAGATWIARTDADCLPATDWTVRIKEAFAQNLELVAGQLLPRADEGVPAWKRCLLVGALELASVFGKLRPGNRDSGYLGPYVMTPGCNMAITAELYLRAGGFPRTKIEDVHEDRALANAVRSLTRSYGMRRNVVVRCSAQRVRAWGLRKTLAWYADHRYRPDLVDIR